MAFEELKDLEKKVQRYIDVLKPGMRQAYLEKLIADITGNKTKSEGEAWRAAVSKFTGEQYDMYNRGNFMNAVRSAGQLTKKGVGFNDAIMDAMTDRVWRLYEYGGMTKSKGIPQPGTRVGGSSLYRFEYEAGKGKSGEGRMVPTNNPALAHPGVYPTRVFQDTFKLNEDYYVDKYSDMVVKAINLALGSK